MKCSRNVVLVLCVMMLSQVIYAGYSQQLTFDNGSAGTSLTDFAVRVSYGPGDTNFWNTIESTVNTSNTGSIRFYDSDSSTELYFEAEKLDYSSKQAEFWVKVPVISAASTTDHIYASWGSASNQTAYNSPEQVWNSTYHGVYHMNENSWSGTSGEVKSSVGTYNGTAQAGARTGAGNIDGGGEFGPYTSGNNVLIGNNIAPYNTLNESVSFWVKSGSTYQNAMIVTSARYQANPYHLRWIGGRITSYFNNGGTSAGTEMTMQRFINDDQWHHIVWQRNGTAETDTLLYVDGELEEWVKGGNGSIWMRDGFAIGGRSDNSASYGFEGNLDEFRFSPDNLSADWIKATYLSESDQFITYGQVVPEPATLGLMGLGLISVLRRKK